MRYVLPTTAATAAVPTICDARIMLLTPLFSTGMVADRQDRLGSVDPCADHQHGVHPAPSASPLRVSVQRHVLHPRAACCSASNSSPSPFTATSSQYSGTRSSQSCPALPTPRQRRPSTKATSSSRPRSIRPTPTLPQITPFIILEFIHARPSCLHR